MKNLNTYLPHLVAIILFFIVPIIYQSPLMDGKVLRSGDVIHGIGNNQELEKYREENGEEALWNSRLFSGMPSFQMTIKHYGNIGEKLNGFISKIGQGTVSIFFMMSLSFYVLLLVFGTNPWLAIALSFGFSLSSFNIISIEAGHNWKIRTLAYVPGILAGVLLIYRDKLLQGAAILSLFLCLHITSNHFQITYYTLLMLLFFGGFELFNAIKSKSLKRFFVATAMVVGASIIGAGPAVSKLWTTMEYSKETIRGGKSELTLAENSAEIKSSGLDRDYAMRWSYSPLECFTMIIPGFMGGASGEELSTSSNIAKAGIPKQFLKSVPTYWGSQPFTSGPVYLGVVLFLLFVFGFFMVKENIKWWLLSYSAFCIILSWGEHFSFVSHFMFDYFPMFNKFRTPSMVLLMLSITFPLMAALGINALLNQKTSKQEVIKALKNSALITLGLLLIFGIFGSYTYDFSGVQDAQLKQAGWPVDKLIEDRADMLRSDTYRSIAFVLLAIAIIWLFTKQKINEIVFIAVLGGLILVDLWGVDKRYLNADDFVKEKDYDAIHAPTMADRQILADQDLHFRVFNVTVNPFTDARTSYFHKSLGGYHAAKLVRYQELIENQLSKNNREVINMLNTKYFIVPDQNKQPAAQPNPEANGVGWFVQKLTWVNNANEEMLALDQFNSKSDAIIDVRFKEVIPNLGESQQGTGAIRLTQYDPKWMIYDVQNTASSSQLAVFSEVYYFGGNEDWKAYIDGVYAPHIRVNYVLRGLEIPAGDHKVEFKFEPKSYLVGNKISMAFSVMLVLLVLGSMLNWWKNRDN